MARKRFTAEQIIMKLREAGEAGPGKVGGRGTMERKRTLSRDRAQFPGGFSRSRSSRRVVA